MIMEYVLSTVINGRKNYVVHEEACDITGKKIVSYHPMVESATIFGSKYLAENYKHRINNPHGRAFKEELLDCSN